MIKVNRSKVGKLYQQTFGWIDSTNQSRLQGACLEKHIPTSKWPFRCYNGVLGISLTSSRKGKILHLKTEQEQTDWFKEIAYIFLETAFKLQGRKLDAECEYDSKMEAATTSSTPEQSISLDILQAHKLQAVPDDRTDEQKRGGSKRANANYLSRSQKTCHMCYNLDGCERSVKSMCSCGLGMCNPTGPAGRDCHTRHLMMGGNRCGKRTSAVPQGEGRQRKQPAKKSTAESAEVAVVRADED
jgi:hypothetical protein